MTNLKTDVTPRQLQILKTITTFADRYCYLPTIAEIAEQLNISRSTVFEHTAELRRKDLLCGSPLKARSLKPTHKASRLLKNISIDNRQEFAQTHGIPLLGKVAAGKPTDSAENREMLSIEDCFGGGDDVFALQVSGDSMLDEGITDGDYVICKRTNTAQNGQIVVALTENENTTLKKFYREPSRVRLQPANENYAPIYSNDCKIQAVAIGLMKKL